MNPPQMFFARDGSPLDMHEAEALLRDIEARQLAVELAPTRFSSGGWARVSTVHLVANWGIGNSRPLIFETMAWPVDEDGNPADGDELGTWRWATEAAAEHGHVAVVAFLVEEGPPPVDDWDDAATAEAASPPA